jgi:phosphatidylethanolamine-binding protein (PEBP) family uncharacterized protein
MMMPVFVLALTLSSTTFNPGATVPMTMVARDCGGKNISPQLSWSGAPSGTKSFVLIVHDPDAPVPGGYYHWVVYNIPATANEIERATTRYSGYYGPCPPPGKVHHYNFTLYALDIEHVDVEKVDAPHLLERIKGHVLTQATLTGLFSEAPR